MKLNVKAFAMAVGTVCGLFLTFMTWSASMGYHMEAMKVIQSFHPWLQPTLMGGVMVFVWGFGMGAIKGGLAAYFYNRF